MSSFRDWFLFTSGNSRRSRPFRIQQVEGIEATRLSGPVIQQVIELRPALVVQANNLPIEDGVVHWGAARVSHTSGKLL